MAYTLVTGASSDIGISICQALEAVGHKLLLSDVSEDALVEARTRLQSPDLHLIMPLDLSDSENVAEVLSAFMADNQVNVSNAVFAAGIFAIKPIKLIDYGFLRKSFDIALLSIWGIMRVLIAKKTNCGYLRSVVLISSVSAKIGAKGYSVYGAVKAGMLGMMKSMASELAPNCRINAVLPGGIRTRTTNFIYEAQEAPNPRYILGDGDKADIANMVEFLLSDKSRWITGQEFIVDGGLTSN